jgi:hypothetical protein
MPTGWIRLKIGADGNFAYPPAKPGAEGASYATIMPMADPDSSPAPSNGKPPRFLDIDLSAGKRWRGLIGYALLVAAVAGLLIYLFVQFTGSLVLAIVLVAFMMGYMGIMGWLAVRKADGKNE